MRPIKTLLALSVALVALAATAAHAAAQTPSVEIDNSVGQPSSFTINGTVDTYGDAADVWVYYFPIVFTTNCTAAPDPADMLNMVQSDPISIAAAEGSRPVSVEVTGLPHESDYCYQLAVRNTANDEATTYMWSVDTTAPAPLLEDATYDSGTNSIAYEVSITANTNRYVAYVDAEYFAKGSGSCDDYSGATTTSRYWGEDSNGFTGFAPQTIGTTISGLSTDTSYCFRLLSNNGHANATPTAWQEVATVSPVATAVSDVALVPPSGAEDANLKLTIDDKGAADAQGVNSSYDVYLYDIGAGRCDSENYFGGTMIVGWGGEFSGEYDFDAGVSGLTLGKPYCVTVFADSAWGESYDAALHQEVWFGNSPGIIPGGAVSTHDSISIPGTGIDPGHLATNYGIEYFAKQPAVACAADSETPRQQGAQSTISTDLGSTATVTPTASGLTQLTTYCFRITASNAWDGAANGWDQITTTKQPVQATITNWHVGTNPLGAQLGRVYATINDGAPHESLGEVSRYSLQAYSAPSSCDVAGTSGLTPHESITNQAIEQDGQMEISRAVGNGTVGQAICVKVSVDSAFGDTYDAVAWYAFMMPGKPEIDDLESSSDKTSITLTGEISATFTSTDYYAEWYVPTTAGCTEVVQSATTDLPFTPNNAPGTVSVSVTGLDPGTRYCARLVAGNDWGTSDNLFESITTVEATVPSVPTGLAASNVTQTSATLTWGASTDDTGVAGYRVFEDETEIASGPATSFAVTLTCGQSRTFTVRAFDANGNESADSNPFTMSAAACSPPPTGTTCKPYLSAPSKTTIKGSVKSRGAKKSKKLKIVVAASRVGNDIKLTTKITGIDASKITLKFNGKKVGRSVTVKGTGDLVVGYPSGKAKKTKKIQVSVVAC